METIILPLRIKIEVQAIPPKCRKPRVYFFHETYRFSMKKADVLPPVALRYKDSCQKKPTEYYLVGKSLYTRAKHTLGDIQETYASRGDRYTWETELPPDAVVIHSKLEERLLRIQKDLDEYLIVGDSIILELSAEPTYHISRHLHSDSVHVDEHPTWGNEWTFRADQFDQANACVEKDSRYKKPPIEVLIPEALQGKFNPGETTLNPKGESPRALFKKFKEAILFYKEFSEDTNIFIAPLEGIQTHIPAEDPEKAKWSRILLTEPQEQEGLWKATLCNSNLEEIRIVLLPCDSEGTILPTGQAIQIGILEDRFSFHAEWKAKIRTLQNIVKSGCPERSEAIWDRVDWNPPASIQKSKTREEREILDRILSKSPTVTCAHSTSPQEESEFS